MDRLAATLEAVASTSSRLKKIDHLAGYFRSLDDRDLARALMFLTGSKDTLSIGYSTLRDAAELASGWDRDLIRLCHREVGDSGETISLLLRGRTLNLSTSLEDAELLYRKLGSAKRGADKAKLLGEAWMRMTPLAIKYFVKSITGNFRVGLQAKLVEEALAASTGVNLADLRAALNRSGDILAVAQAARAGSLAQVEAQLFHPLEFMLAKPHDEAQGLPDAAEYFVEDKYDGIRSQAHWDAGKVRIFTRGMEDSTQSFPDLAEAFLRMPGRAVLDGEVLAWRDGRALNFTVLQQRLARKKLSAEILAEVPLAFIAYDVLYANGRLLLDEAIETRRSILESLLASVAPPLMLSPSARLSSSEEIDARFAAARARGNEGLLLKRAGSVYEAGKRSAQWLKVKRAYATLDVVVTAAEQGTGRRATMLSDYTFAVRDGERYLNVGKAYSGLTDEEIRALTRHFRSIATGRFGRVTVVQPEVVLEVAFDGIQKSPRHKSGFALRFPRILHWRKDKRPEEADTLERVQEIYASTLAQ